MSLATVTVLAPLAVFAAPWPAAEVLVPLLAVFAGVGGTWLQAVHPPAAAYGDDPALVALLVV